MFAQVIYILFSLLALWPATVDGAIRFANVYQDHMVLQRAPQRAVVWGYTDSFNTLTILTVNNKIYRTKSSSSPANAANESIWSVMLDAQTQEGPFQVKVSQTLPNGTLATIELNDVLFGDVWICSGQSNMGFTVSGMYNGSIEIANAGKYPKVRLFAPGRDISDTPLDELKVMGLNWSVASPQSVGSGYASAVCWLYGRMIHEGLGGRPIGLIHSSWGGTPIELWSPPQVLRDCGIPKSQPDLLKHIENPKVHVGAGFNNSDLYNAMIHPFTRMVVTGAIWYQGENNAGYNRDKYNCTFPKMIQAWRDVWSLNTNYSTNPNFPFGFVQLSTNDKTGTVIGGFPWIRWHQTFDVGYVPNHVQPNVFMAVALDLRDDERGIHPRDKLDVGYRLSRSGLAVAYGFKNVTYQGPIIADISVSSDSSKINITYSSEVSTRVELRNPAGFEVCCQAQNVCRSNDMQWVVTVARSIQGEPLKITLTVADACAKKPINGLRYLWRETPCLFKEAAVYSGEDSDLPAPPYIHYFE